MGRPSPLLSSPLHSQQRLFGAVGRAASHSPSLWGRCPGRAEGGLTPNSTYAFCTPGNRLQHAHQRPGRASASRTPRSSSPRNPRGAHDTQRGGLSMGARRATAPSRWRNRHSDRGTRKAGAKANEKNITVSSIEPITEPTRGAAPPGPARRRPVEHRDVEHLAEEEGRARKPWRCAARQRTREKVTPTMKPQITTIRAYFGPNWRLVRSVTQEGDRIGEGTIGEQIGQD